MEIDRLEILIEAEASKASAELDKLVSKLNRVSSAMSSIKGFNIGSPSSNIKATTQTLSGYTKSTASAIKGTHSLTSQLSRLAFAFYSVRRAVGFLGNSIEKSMDYTETINLFETSFKKIGMETARKMGMEWGSETADVFAKEFIYNAKSFNNRITEALSLDPELMLNYQAVFAQMTNSMGLVADSSMAISESFTMLGNDIASLWNIDTDKAMKKLQSGLAGQIRPLRELGVDISQTSLEMTALNYGIEDSIKDMSQAAKVQLRWLAIMDQTEVAFGDMAKTLDSPANQLRILRQQWTNLSRSIGNVFLPVVTTILPYINGLVIALRRLIDTIATAVGFELPDYSDSNIYTDVTTDIVGGYDDAADSIDDATKATEKLKKATLGIDELNILSKNSGSSGGGSGSSSGGGSGYGELDNAISDKTNSYMNKFNEELANMKNNAENIANMIQPKLEKFVEWMGKISPLLAGIAAAFVTYKTLTWFADLATKIGAFSLSPIGVIAIAIGAFVAIGTALRNLQDDAAKADLEKRFGDIQLSIQEVQELAQALTDGEYGLKLDVYISEKAKLDEFEKNIQDNIDTLNKLNWKVSVGLDLTEGEQAQYKEAIESFIKNSNAYIDQQQYVVSLAIGVAVTDDTAFASEMQTMANNYYSASRGELEALGTKLRTAMDEALADGVLDADESRLITNLQKEMSEVLERTADAEFTAKLQMITVDGELTADSFKAVTEEVAKIAQERIDKATEAEFTTRAVIVANYKMNMENATTQTEKNKLTKEYEADLAKLTEEFSKTKATITMDGVEFSTGILLDKYGPEIERVAEKLGTDFSGTVAEWIGKGDTEWNSAIELAVHNAGIKFEVGLNDIDISARLGMEKLFESLAPTQEQQLKLAEDALKAGKAVPENVSKGLTDTSMLGAVAGDLDSINFLMGQKLSTDPTFLEALATSETAGKDLDSSLIAGLKSMIPDLKSQGDSLVFDLDGAIKTATEKSATENMPVYTGAMVDGANEGISKNQSKSQPIIEEWANKINKWFTGKTNKTEFEKNGKSDVDGYNSGISKNQSTSQAKMETWAGKVRKWFTNDASKTKFETHGKNIVLGLNSGVSSSQSSSQSIIESWAKKISGWFTTFFDEHSPSRVALGWGKNIVFGFNNGIKQYANTSTKYIDDWAKGIGNVDTSIGLNIEPLPSNMKFATEGIPGFNDVSISQKANVSSKGAIAPNNQVTESVNDGFRDAIASVMIPLMSNTDNGNSKVVVESNLYVDSEKMYEISQKGKQKFERRNQTSLNLG